MADARQFEERLNHAYADGGFLVLTVRPSRMRPCEAELLRRFRLHKVSFDDLLFDALRRAYDQRTQVGSTAVVVDAKHDAARAFYEHHEFRRFPEREYRLYLTMKTIGELLSRP